MSQLTMRLSRSAASPLALANKMVLTVADLRQLLGKRLGIEPDSIPTSVVSKAVSEPLFRHHLLVSQGDEFLLRRLFGEAEAGDRSSEADWKPSNLVWAAGVAGVRWLTSGARLVDKNTYLRRTVACEQCIHRRASPSTGLQGLTHDVRLWTMWL